MPRDNRSIWNTYIASASLPLQYFFICFAELSSACVTEMHNITNDGYKMSGRVTHDDKSTISSSRLGTAGLALHYANVINQMDIIASRPTSLPPNVRDTLYRGLPESVKDALCFYLRKLDSEDEVPQIKAEMEKILEWLSAMAMNTLIAHQGFGWVGEWANSSEKTGESGHIIGLQILYHAIREKMDTCILTLITQLHWLINAIKRIAQRDHGLSPLPLHSPAKNMSLKIYPSIYHAKKSLGSKDV